MDYEGPEGSKTIRKHLNRAGNLFVSKMALLVETDGKIVNSRVEKVGMLYRYSKYRRKEAGGCGCHRQCCGWHIKPAVRTTGGCAVVWRGSNACQPERGALKEAAGPFTKLLLLQKLGDSTGLERSQYYCNSWGRNWIILRQSWENPLEMLLVKEQRWEYLCKLARLGEG